MTQLVPGVIVAPESEIVLALVSAVMTAPEPQPDMVAGVSTPEVFLLLMVIPVGRVSVRE